MRVILGIAALSIVAAGAAAQRPKLTSPDCPSVTSHLVEKGGRRGDPTRPKKLGELPPADAYAAVYTLDERGCMVPVKFRDVRR